MRIGDLIWESAVQQTAGYHIVYDSPLFFWINGIISIFMVWRSGKKKKKKNIGG
jgi:hypothetical protein